MSREATLYDFSTFLAGRGTAQASDSYILPGSCRSYGEIAIRVGNKNGSRFVVDLQEG